MKRKKLLSVLLATVLLLTCIPMGAVSVNAATSGTTGDCTWSTTWSSKGTVLTISGEGAMGDYDNISAPWGKNIISVTIEDGVTHIGDRAFYYCDKLTEVTIPNSVISIGDSAFAQCTNLTTVSIGESVAVIGTQAFHWCSKLTSLSIPDSVTTIGEGAFGYCYGLTKLILPDSVTSIGAAAFGNCCYLTSISVGSGVTSIGRTAFEWCTSLEEVCITDLAAWCSIDFYNYLSNPLYYAHNLYLNGNLITKLTIPNSVTNIGDYVFYYCDSLTSVTIPDSVTKIGDYAFSWCTNLASVTIGESVTNIGNCAFSNCDKLTEVTIGDSVATIGNYAFYYCISLTTIAIPSSVTVIGDWVFEGCDSLTTIEVDEHNTNYSSVEGVLFAKDNMTLLRCPEGKVGNYTVPNSTNSIDNFAFRFCDKLTSVVISDSVTCIGLSAFDWCTGLTSVTIGNSVATIENYAFDNCTSLISVTIGDSVTTIGNGAFRFCDSLTDAYYNGSEDDKSNITIGSSNDTLLNATWHYADDPISDEVTHSVMDTENGNGLAFRFELAAKDVTKNRINKANLTNATINYLGTDCKLIGMGSVVTNSDAVAENLTLDAINDYDVINVPTVYLQEVDEDSCVFATRIIDIPDSAVERTIYARPYFIVEVDGEQITVYGDVSSASCAEYM